MLLQFLLIFNFYSAQNFENFLPVNISEPKAGENFFISSENFLEEKKIKISGISYPKAKNFISILNPIPQKISEFSAEISDNKINFYWTPRQIFLNENLDKILPRNQDFTLPEISPENFPTCQQKNNQQFFCQENEKKIFRNCQTEYFCQQNWFSQNNEKISNSVNSGKKLGIKNFYFFWEELRQETESFFSGDGSCTPPICSDPPEARGKKLITDFSVLVNDFKKYEIWFNFEQDLEKPYFPSIGVIRDEKISNFVAEIYDPKKNNFEIDISNLKNSAGKIFNRQEDKIYFAIFEISQTNLLIENTKKNHQITAKNEIFFDPKAEKFSKIFSPQKWEFSLENKEIFSDDSGQFITDFSILNLNETADFHIISGKYTGDNFWNNFFSSQNNFTKKIGNNLEFPVGFFRNSGKISGEIFDFWTKQKIPNATIKIKNNFSQENLETKTDIDGIFNFFPENSGDFSLEILIFDQKNNFNFLQNCEFFGDFWCGEILEIKKFPKKIKIPVLPKIFGEIKNCQNKTGKILLQNAALEKLSESEITNNCRFSFFLNPEGVKNFKIIWDSGEISKNYFFEEVENFIEIENE